MASISFGLAWCVAATFVWAGLAKLWHWKATESAMAKLHVSAIAARLVPFAELAVPALMVVSERLAMAWAMLLLLCFTGFLLVTIHHGREVSCGCFGATASEPVSVVDVGRNLVLLGAAVLGAVQGASNQMSVPGFMVAVGLFGVGAMGLALGRLRRATGALFTLELLDVGVGV